MLPKHIKSWNVFIDGVGYAGIAEKVKLPTLERAMEEWIAAGMGGKIKLDFGHKPLEMGFTLGEFSPAILRLWGNADPSGINARFLAAAGDGSETEAIEISVRGRFEKNDFGDVEMQKQAKLDVTMPLTYYRYNRNGITLIEVDLLSGTEMVGGINLSEAMLRSMGYIA